MQPKGLETAIGQQHTPSSIWLSGKPFLRPESCRWVCSFGSNRLIYRALWMMSSYKCEWEFKSSDSTHPLATTFFDLLGRWFHNWNFDTPWSVRPTFHHHNILIISQYAWYTAVKRKFPCWKQLLHLVPPRAFPRKSRFLVVWRAALCQPTFMWLCFHLFLWWKWHLFRKVCFSSNWPLYSILDRS